MVEHEEDTQNFLFILVNPATISHGPLTGRASSCKPLGVVVVWSKDLGYDANDIFSSRTWETIGHDTLECT